MKRTIIILLLSLLICKAHAQAIKFSGLIEASEAEIKTRMDLEDGILKKDVFVLAWFGRTSHREMNYSFASSPANDELYFANFYLSRHKNECIQYDLWYHTDKYTNKLISELTNMKTKWRRVGKDLKWIKTLNNGYGNLEVDILERKNEKGGKTTAFILQVKEVDI